MTITRSFSMFRLLKSRSNIFKINGLPWIKPSQKSSLSSFSGPYQPILTLCSKQKASNRVLICGIKPVNLVHPRHKSDGDSKRDGLDKKTRAILQTFTKLTPHEYIYTLPNILTFSRLFAAPVIGYLVLNDYHTLALCLFTYAGITDLIDGWIARRWRLQTVVGTVIDPMADKILMTILTACLAIKGSLPFYLAVIILGRDMGLALAAIYYRWISLPPPRTFTRYWDFSLPSAEVRPTTISKYNTALQLALIGATMSLPLIPIDISSAMLVMQYLVATTTVASGASYIFSKNAVKILKH